MKLVSSAIAVLVSLSWLVSGCSSTALDHADSGQPAADHSDFSCEYNGTSHAPGTSFPSIDSCNTCSCTDSGRVACTLRACPIDAQILPICSLTATYAFRFDGGLRPYVDRSTLAPARTHTLSRDTLTNAPPATCSRELPCANDDTSLFGVSDVLAALDNPDVTAALSMTTPPFYGTDPRPYDGSVFIFQRDDGRGFTVGDSSVPAGLRALQNVLTGIQADTLASPGCASLPGGR